MLRLTDLPSNVLSGILDNLDQISLVNLSYTCKFLHEISCSHIYSNIYIAAEDSTLYIKDLSLNISNWCIVRNSLSPGGNLKKLERSFSENTLLISFIRRIASNDLHFILFKLKFWGKRFFNWPNSLHSVNLVNMPSIQINSIHGELFSFYKNSTISLRELQLKSIDELIRLLFIGNLNNVEHISFHLINESDNFETKTNINKLTRADLILLFNNLKGLKIHSEHNQGFQFLLLLRKLFSRDKLFLSLNEFEINHVHLKSQESEKLMLATVNGLIDIAKVEKLALRVDCDNIYKATLEGNSMDIARNNGYCSCLEMFFEDFLHFLRSYDNGLRLFTIIKESETVLDNPFSIYYFKFHLLSLLSNLKNTKELTINTKSIIFPIHNLMGNESFSNMVHIIKELNTELLRIINNMQLEKLRIFDFFESFQMWELATLEITKDNLNYYCKCSQCEETKLSLVQFLEVSEQIQFYLDPASYNVFLSSYYNLISVILSYVKNGPVSGWRNDSVIHNFRLRTDIQTVSIPSSISLIGTISQKEPLNLHLFYRHHNYKTLIGYRSMELRRTPKAEVSCSCDGTEYMKFASFISHQLLENLFLYNMNQNCEMYLDELPIIGPNTNK